MKRLNFESIKIKENLVIQKQYILITYTTGIGQVPKSTKEFLKVNYENLVGISVSGNKNWGANFTKAADIISQQYNIPILLRFELSGNQNDVDKFTQEVHKIVSNSNAKMDFS